MKVSDIDRLREIKTFPSLVKYLREELGWPIESDDIEEITYDWSAEELSLDAANAAKIESIKQLIPLSSQQPWGIFFIKFERKRLPIVALRLILGRLVLKRRDSARRADQPAWHCNDLLFISAYGDHDERQISLAHFAEDEQLSAHPTLRVLGWEKQAPNLRLDHVADELRTKLRWPEDKEDIESWRKRWSEAFVLGPGEVIKTSKDLAVRLADLARRIRKDANDVLRIESERGPLRRLHKAFQESLIHDLSEDDFADMYAQTVAYGLLAARVSRPAGVIADNLADMVPDTNAFLKEMLSTFLTVGEKKGAIDFDELGIQNVFDLLNSPNTHMEDILRDFGHRTQREDPVMHFYELFLKEYDKKKKVKRGVFYTPQPVVSFIVRSVDEILRTEFGLEDGLADTTTWDEMAERHKELTIPEHAKPSDPFVQILDPAAGTGTFLVEVIDIIHQTMTEKWKAEEHMELEFGNLWNEYVPKHLLPRIYGFELMMAPYTIAHMKVSLKLFETGYRFRSAERVRIFLTNSLEPSRDFSDTFEQMAPTLAHEAQAANQVKTETRITVVIGNPPYSVVSQNAGDWITCLMQRYKKAVHDERNIQPLSDDYLKFIRFAHHCIERAGAGIITYVTNHTYLTGVIHRGLRQELLKDFHLLKILDMHGSTLLGLQAPNGKPDINIFDIQQGVSISQFVRLIQDSGPPRVFHRDLWGTRQAKQDILLSPSEPPAFREIVPQPPNYFFVPTTGGDQAYLRGWSMSEIFPVATTGFVTGCDASLVSFDPEIIEMLVDDLTNERNTDKDILAKYHIADTKGWPVSRRREALIREKDRKRHIRKIAYRPFDNRYTCYCDFLQRSRYKTFRHLLSKNLALIASRFVKGEKPAHSFVTRLPTEKIFISPKTSNNAFVFPLYLYPEGSLLDRSSEREVNLSTEFLSRFRNLGTGGEIANLPLSVFHYAYAVFHSPEYRRRYAEFLKIDFPRLPLTSNLDLFRALAKLGSELVALHLMESPELDNHITTPAGSREFQVEKVSYSDETVWLNKAKSTGFRGVPEDVWNFHIGGYQVCQKWLKDRGPKKGKPGRVLTQDDITHYHKIVVALNETIRLMKEIDQVIEQHGGWPNAFVTDKSDPASREPSSQR